MRKLLVFVIAILFACHGMAQSQDLKARIDSINKATILYGDTIPHLDLDEVAIMAPPHFKSRRAARKYWRLVNNLKKVLPYARVVNSTVADIEKKISVTSTDKERRKIVRAMEDSLWNEYEPELRKMTITQGKLLFKLVAKESDQTSYYWIEYYKGSFSAFFWQGIARIFGTNLKSGFDMNNPDDMLIDQLVRYIDLGYI